MQMLTLTKSSFKVPAVSPLRALRLWSQTRKGRWGGGLGAQTRRVTSEPALSADLRDRAETVRRTSGCALEHVRRALSERLLFPSQGPVFGHEYGTLQPKRGSPNGLQLRPYKEACYIRDTGRCILGAQGWLLSWGSTPGRRAKLVLSSGGQQRRQSPAPVPPSPEAPTPNLPMETGSPE